jgi:hypothetical protein
MAPSAKNKKAKDAKNQAAERALEDEKRVLKEKMDAAGLSHIDHKLPDEDLTLDDPRIRKSLWKSIKGLFPGTDEYYEGMAAEDEMDDLKAIRIEKARANDYLAMTKTGKHEEALAVMMAETNNDFFFFNKLMTKYREEDKWKFEAPELNPFGLMEAAQRRNRIRRAFRATYQLTSNSQESALQGTLNAMKGTKNLRNTATNCNWKGKSKQGESLRCKNDRLPHPTMREKDPVTGKEGPVLFDTCAYHSANCVEEHGKPVAINVPNKFAFCTECHVSKQPGVAIQSMMRMDTSPGVCPASALAALPSAAELDAKVANDNTLTEDSICCWLAGKKEISLRGWQCGNKVIRNSTNKVLQNVCGWHVTICLRQHTGGGSNAVEIPNKHGLCVMHHTAEFGEEPIPAEFPYPGMLVRKAKNAWMSEGHHWAAPNWAPSHPREAVEYEPPDLPEDFIQRVMAAGKYAKFLDRKRREGMRSAAKVQATWRRFKLHASHLELARQKMRRDRLEKVILIQVTGRKRMAYNRVKKMREQRNKAALLVQKHFRGWVARRRAREYWAGKRILKLFKKLNFFKFKDAVILMMQLKKMSRRRHSNAITIQRVARGYQTRCVLFERKLWTWIQNRAARIITREIRAYNERIPISTEFVYPTMAWAKKQCGKRLAKLIWKLIVARRDRSAFIKQLEYESLHVQRHARGFIARKGAAKMRFLHTEMNKWIKPQYALEFTERFFESNIFYMKDRIKKTKPPPPPPPEPTWLLRPFLPESIREEPDVSEEDFYAVIALWYKQQAVPLLTSEVRCLREEFANPASGKVIVGQVEDYIKLSVLPCRKHGRRICGKCMYRGRCSQKGCTCPEYHPSKEGQMTSICRDCFHTPDIHRRCPLQMKEGTKPRSMLQLMRAVREPDTSMPSTVQGISFEDTIVPPEDPLDVRMRIYEKLETKQKFDKTSMSDYRASTLNLMLMFLEEKGENVAELDEYWGQSEIKMVGDLTTDLSGKKVQASDKANVSMPIYPVPPNTNLTVDEFWDNMAKNPNKSKRDYDEKFDHNMPMPVVQSSQIVYTFEGSKVYLNILIQIIDIGEGKIPGAAVHYDNPDFLRLVTNHIQIFERHWRKMVADLRKGTLNRNAVVSDDDRTMFEALSLPRVALSKTLDDAFRDLGFHTKAMGKDIKATQYAERIRFHARQPKDRRLSLPMTPGSTLVGQDSRDLQLRGELRLKGAFGGTGQFVSPQKAREDRKEALRASSPLAEFALGSRSGSRGRSRGGSRGGSRGESRGGSHSPERLGGSPPGSRPGSKSGLHLESKSRRELLVMVGESMKGATAEVDMLFRESRSRGPSRRTAGDRRRGSETDIARDVNMNELHALNTEQLEEPRTGYHFTIQIDGDRFICPFPACGKSFKSKDAAFKHLPIHEQRTRLYAPTALPDSHLNFYWPANPPWEKHEQFTETRQPVGNCKCKHPGCNKSFANQEKLENHKRLVHNAVPASSTEHGHYMLQGVAICVPPFKPPENVAFSVQYCDVHLNPYGGCMKCIELEKRKGPKPPFRFYEGIRIDMRAKAEAAKVQYASTDIDASKPSKKKTGAGKSRSPSPSRGGTKPLDAANDGLNTVHLKNHDQEQAILYRKMVGIVPSSHMAYVCAVMTDKSNEVYLGVRPFLPYAACLAHDIEVPRDFDKANELMALPDQQDEDFSWIPVATVFGAAPVFYVSGKKVWKSLVKKGQAPKNSYFIRES